MERKLTRFLTLMLSLLVMVSLCAATVSAEELKTSENPKCYLHGDVNGDGKVGTQDAIYTLYYAMWHDVDETLYPVINQDFDFTGEGKVSAKDALYLLWASMGDENYELDGDIHEYYKPYWTWDVTGEVPVATLNVRCGCGEPIKLGAEEGVRITSVITEATCVASGKAEHTAKVTYEGVEYISEPYTVVIPAVADGHQMVGTQGCETKSECELCDYELPALGHSWVLNAENSIAATCTTEGQQWYDCACGAHYTVAVGKVPHTHAFAGAGEAVLKEGTTCTYVVTNTYRCSCGDEITQDSQYDKHTYKAVVTQEATCNAAGVKIYVCESCGHEKGQSEQIPVNADAHKWGDGELNEATGITTHTCSACGTTKTTVAVAKEQEISNDQLSNELQLENANVSLDEKTVAGLDAEKTIQISVEPAEENAVSLTEEQKEQVGNNTIYDFSMIYSDGEPVTNFDGYVTVSLPYTLSEGEDVDAIDVWYIDDKGELAQMEGTYANGYVTFKTNHFSYYTVTRLTPAERCARYGHILVAAEKAATCTEEGYKKNICQRCGKEEDVVVIPALEHDYTDGSDAKAATCAEAGLKHQVCDRCDHEVKEELPALGHDLVADQENSQAADCGKPGKAAKCCDREGCAYTIVEELPQLKHDFGTNPKETLYPDCTSGGHDHQKCTLCEQDIISNETAPLGHDYGVESWTWNEDHSAATAKLVCKINPEHTLEVKAAVSAKTEAATCTDAGYTTYTAVISHNKKEYTDAVTMETAATGHQTSGEWNHTETEHYRICSVCGGKADRAGHTWDEVVTKEPTCAEAGTQSNTCIYCGYAETVRVSATGQHDMVDGECSVCGFTEESCRHTTGSHAPVDLSGHDVCEGLELVEMCCECGQEKYVYIQQTNCEFGEETVTETTLSDGTVVTVHTMVCTKCGFTYGYGESFMRYDEEYCIGYYADYCCIGFDGKIEAEYVITYRSNMMAWEHPEYKVTETVDLSTLGLCGGTLEVIECKCGAAVYTTVKNNQCSWNWVDDVAVCSACGATRTLEYGESEKIGCTMVEPVTVTYQKDGQTVYTHSGTHAYGSHNYELVEYELYGETCEEGIWLHRACQDCGHEYDGEYGWHVGLFEERTDLSGYGSCDTVLYQYICACGAERYGYAYNENGDDHDWTVVSDDPDTKTTVLTCSKCNYTCTTVVSVSENEGDCSYLEVITETFTDGNGHSYSCVSEGTYTSHNYEREFILNGDSCEDGVEIRQTCTDCGDSYRQRITYDHSAYEVACYDLAEYGLCGGEVLLYECPCKENTWFGSRNTACNWEWVDGDENSTTWKCATCGATRVERTELVLKIDDCHRKVKRSRAYYKDGEELVSVSYNTNETTHRDVYSFTMQDPDMGCDGGYQVSAVCQTCGENSVWDYTEYGHCNYAIARETVSVNQLCGDLELVTYGCPCGQDMWVGYEWSNGSCDFQWQDGQSVCTKCGAIRTDDWTYKAIEGEACKVTATYSIVIVRNGKTVCDFSYDVITTNHKEVTKYNLEGETCDDGYTYTVECAECGVILYEQAETVYGCGYRTVEIVTLLSHEDICGDVTLRRQSCACGKKTDVWTDYNCDFDHMGWDSVNQRDQYQCQKCGLIRYSKGNREHISGTCTANRSLDHLYELNGETVGSFQGEYVVEDHNRVATFDLYGTTCDDGYTVYETCVGCGIVDSWESSGHNHYLIGYYEMADYGMCDGEIYVYGCACGQEYGGMGWDMDCDWDYKGYDDATDTQTSYCSACNTFRYSTTVGQRDPETCTYTGTETWTFVRDNETLLDLTYNHNYESHDMVALEAVLMNPEGDCESGVTVTEQCVDCGHTWTETYYHHYTTDEVRIDLSDGCGGELRYGSCACGENHYFHLGYECENMTRSDMGKQGDDGIYYNHVIRTCPDCGLVVDDQWYDVDAEGCQSTCYETYTVTYGGETYVWEYTDTWDNHKNLTYTGATLYEDSETCEDGVSVQWICDSCGATGEYGFSRHELVRQESLDLSKYGSYCGATLDLYACACGYLQRYEIGEDSECDVHNNSIANWVPGTVDDAQETSEGWRSTYSNSYLVKCAVTDPVTCGMTIRMSEYWLVEDCMAVEYQTWQLNYDEATGSYDREITIATGEQHAYHNYTETDISETLEDGSRVSGVQWTCPDCGSYGYQKYYYDENGIHVKNEYYFENSLYATNGENQSRYSINEYGLIANDHSYETYYYWEEVHADGTKEWHREEYSDYDFSGECKRTRTYSDESGYTETGVVSAHIETCEYYNDPEPTCSQHGTRHHVHECPVCGKGVSHDTWELEPTGHNWYWDDSKQVYVCSDCELENAVGTTGSIYMEDLTDDATWGSQSEYVVGYWNSDNIEVTPQVSVILDDVTDGDNQYVLSGITFDYLTVNEDGVRALTFSKADAQTAAETTMQNIGYTGSYAIRISFVPTTGDNTLDYAITFDSQTMAQ